MTTIPLTELTWNPQPRQCDWLRACGLGDCIGEAFKHPDTGQTVYRLKEGKLAPPQASLIGLGGAAGGGKSDTALAVAGILMCLIPNIRIVYFRREYPELEGADGAISRSRTVFGRVKGAVFNEGKHRWEFRNGSQLFFRACQYEANRFQFQSQEFNVIICDEATHFSWTIVDYLLTRNRAKVVWPGLGRAYPFALFPTNPGNIGHHWYRQVFVDSGEPDVPHQAETPNGQSESVIFLPARLEDNPILRTIDPDYERKLESRDPDTVKALRWGDWNVAAGLFFGRHWRSVPMNGKLPHIIEPIPIPDFWKLSGSWDYGFSPRTPDEKPFVYGLYAVDTEGHEYRIDEVAGAHMDASDQITAVKTLEEHWCYRDGQKFRRIEYRQGCPAMFIRKEEGGPTIAEQCAVAGVPVVRSKTDRVNGWSECLLHLREMEDGIPRFRSFSTCAHFNKQIPSLPSADKRTDDIDGNAEDHAAEEWRHWTMSRPPVSYEPLPKLNPLSMAHVFQVETGYEYEGDD